MLNKILNLIEKIPEEVKECFAIIISEKDGKKLLQEIYNKQHIFENYKKINSFPLSIMNIPVIIGFTMEPYLEPINSKDTLLKLYYYELYRFNNFMKEYEKLKEKLQQKEDIINKAKEYIKDNANIYTNIMGKEVGFFKENDGKTPIELLEILDNKGE